MEEKEILEYAQRFVDDYYQRHISDLIPMLHVDICWSHYYCRRIIRGIQDVKELFWYEQRQDYVFEVKHVYFHDICYKNKMATVLYDVDLNMIKEHTSQPMKLYGRLVFIEESHRILLYEVNMSLYQSDEQLIQSISHEDLKQIQYENAMRIKQMNNDLEVLTNNVPGGIFKCLYNEELTILYMSDGFLSMFGYTREEIKEYFHDSFWEMIAPDDREPTLKEVQRQMKLGHTKRIEYRVLHKDQHYVWVLDKGQLIEDIHGGIPSFYCIMIDVTQEKKIEEELRLSLERYNIIMDQTDDVIIEWDIIHKQLRFSSNWKTVFDNSIFGKNQVEIEELKKGVYPYDAKKLDDILLDIHKGKHYIEKEIRILNDEHQYRWWKLRLTVQFDQNNKPLRAIGIIIDIDEEKRHSQYLLHIAQQDALTGIYNKMTTQNLIKDYLSQMDPQQVSAMMIIDIDNFKEINDSKGHLFGDAILGDIARRMKNDFHYTDIIGRIGGDEFIVFLRDIQSHENIEKGAQRMLDEMKALEKNHEGLHISCSIGISIVPRDGMEFSELFQKADRALYRAKSEGKKQYVIYDESLIHQYMMNAKPRSFLNEKIDSNENNHISGGQIAEYVFRILYNSSDIQYAVSTILEIVGLQFDVSRVYIFENIENEMYCCNTFEWCNQGVEPQRDVLQHVSYEKDLGGNYIDNFDENGIFYCSDIKTLPKLQYDILAPQGIKSMLQCAIKDNGVFKGYVGFDECRQNRYWTQEQIDVLVFISEILSVFLLKNRVEGALKQESQGLLNLLNNQSSWIYVINPQNYQMLFINQKTRELCPEAMIGKPCHEMFMQRQTPCDFCPVKNIQGDCFNQKVQVYNPYFHVWVDVDATPVNWQGEDAVMISCHDITDYKK